MIPALQRSCGRAAVIELGIGEGQRFDLAVASGATDDWADSVLNWINSGRRKLVVFGGMPERLRRWLGFSDIGLSRVMDFEVEAESAAAGHPRESRARIRYTPLASRLGGKPMDRPFARYDLGTDWDNLGTGFITTDGSAFAVGTPFSVREENELARIEGTAGRSGSYAGLFDFPETSVLWFNREVGPIDSPEWRLVERFLADYRADDLPCQPIIEEIPFGHDAAFAVRVASTADVAATQALFELYGELDIPLSLTMDEAAFADPGQRLLLHNLVEGGNCVLPTLAPRGGIGIGGEAIERHEARKMADTLERLTGKRPLYAIMPGNSADFALKMPADADYSGVMLGSSTRQPQMLLARGGTMDATGRDFMAHSRSCLIHGAALSGTGDPLKVYRQAIEAAIDSATMLCFTDQAVGGDRGFASEAERLGLHRDLIAEVRLKADNPSFLSCDVAMDFLARKSKVEIADHGSGFLVSNVDRAGPGIAARYRGKLLPLAEGMLL